MNMLEVYLFINPISESCYKTEKKIMNLIDKSVNKVCFRVLPLLTLSTIKHAMRHAGLPISMHKEVVNTLYQASLDYEAALFQGQKRGHEFLLKVQECILKHNFKYTDKMVQKVAQQSKLDLSIFADDRNSHLAEKAFRKNQQIAVEMQIKDYPTVVISNTDYPEYALSIDPLKSFEILKKIILNPKETLGRANNHHYQYLHSAKLKK